jgi:hypothetical protein
VVIEVAKWVEYQFSLKWSLIWSIKWSIISIKFKISLIKVAI